MKTSCLNKHPLHYCEVRAKLSSAYVLLVAQFEKRTFVRNSFKVLRG